MRHAGRARARHMADDGQEQLVETRHDLLLSGFAHAKPVASGWQLRRRVLSPESVRRRLPRRRKKRRRDYVRSIVRRCLETVEAVRGSRTPDRRPPTKTRQATE